MMAAFVVVLAGPVLPAVLLALAPIAICRRASRRDDPLAAVVGRLEDRARREWRAGHLAHLPARRVATLMRDVRDDLDVAAVHRRVFRPAGHPPSTPAALLLAAWWAPVGMPAGVASSAARPLAVPVAVLAGAGR